MHENHFYLRSIYSVSWQSHSQNIASFLPWNLFTFVGSNKKCHKHMIHGLHEQCTWIHWEVWFIAFSKYVMSNFWYILWWAFAWNCWLSHFQFIHFHFISIFPLKNKIKQIESFTKAFSNSFCVLFILCVFVQFFFLLDYTMQTMLRTSPVERNEWIKIYSDALTNICSCLCVSVSVRVVVCLFICLPLVGGGFFVWFSIFCLRKEGMVQEIKCTTNWPFDHDWQ